MVIDPEEKKSMTRTPVKKQGDHTISMQKQERDTGRNRRT